MGISSFIYFYIILGMSQSYYFAPESFHFEYLLILILIILWQCSQLHRGEQAHTYAKASVCRCYVIETLQQPENDVFIPQGVLKY